MDKIIFLQIRDGYTEKLGDSFNIHEFIEKFNAECDGYRAYLLPQAVEIGTYNHDQVSFSDESLLIFHYPTNMSWPTVNSKARRERLVSEISRQIPEQKKLFLPEYVEVTVVP